MAKSILPKLIFYTATVSSFSLIYINNVKELSYNFIDKINSYHNWTKGNEYGARWNNLSVYSNEIKNQVLTNTKEKYELEHLGRVLADTKQYVHASGKRGSHKYIRDYDTASTTEDDNISIVSSNAGFTSCIRNILGSFYKKKKHKKRGSPIPTLVPHIVSYQMDKNKIEPTPDSQPYSINCTIRKFPDADKTNGHCIKGENYMVLARGGFSDNHPVVSRDYVRHFLTLFKNFVSRNKEIKSKDAIEYAYENSYYKGEISLCAIVMNDDNTISASIIGNQQYRIIRDGKIVHKGQDPKNSYGTFHTIGTNKNIDTSDVMNEVVPVEKDDIIISGSNIIWGTLDDDQILAIASSIDFSMLSKAIARSTYIYAIEELRNTSYTSGSIGFINEKCLGVKDDISVACARIN
ncbi:protein phosphatase PPM10, putative [Plasmodium chabaudi chabaudi]|uniref:Protein phosphatase PPM10, putative n=1 Tax=Plasmodium chabaudi chabaudi TaxID=31271 RepID=A0A4V0K930_PLACU|nr:protein phosphatase PPM10, putative [Plasmodium chabaudi chabaudi]VTZ69557.1 protein phosphatase PPM10, putative [Plasmodium chabaudi chabaudi]|eukprot:XP_745240.2 protein phosphatase, putative [Plasmodium chabaudi chabaudi]